MSNFFTARFMHALLWRLCPQLHPLPSLKQFALTWWRIVTPQSCPCLAAKKCPYGMEYTECATKCQRTCKTLYMVMPPECMNECIPGCQCMHGTFLHHDQCIPADECPCVYRNKEYASGDTMPIGCNKWCVCLIGDIVTLVDLCGTVSLTCKLSFKQDLSLELNTMDYWSSVSLSVYLSI